jgi:hypothetical protein
MHPHVAVELGPKILSLQEAEHTRYTRTSQTIAGAMDANVLVDYGFGKGLSWGPKYCHSPRRNIHDTPASDRLYWERWT